MVLCGSRGVVRPYQDEFVTPGPRPQGPGLRAAQFTYPGIVPGTSFGMGTGSLCSDSEQYASP